MRRYALVAAMALAFLCARPAPAGADFTAFWGGSTAPVTRPARGLALGISLIVIGFEFEYANIAENVAEIAPGLKTGMLNGLVQTPTRTQLYLTAGGGFYRESLGAASATSFGTNIGGGVKIGLAGPLKLRLDYRIFSLRGNPLHKTPQRFYGGLNVSF